MCWDEISEQAGLRSVSTLPTLDQSALFTILLTLGLTA